MCYHSSQMDKDETEKGLRSEGCGANTARRMPRLVFVAAAYAVSLAVTFALVPPESWQWDVVTPTMAAAAMMLFFGPYLLVVGCPAGFGLGRGSLLGLLCVLPFYVAHVFFISSLSKRTSLWRRMGRFGERVRRTAVVLWALMSAVGVWCEMPEVTEYAVHVDDARAPSDGIRLAVVTDLHSCKYGSGQKALVDAVKAQSPDAVLLVGDIFDDRLPDDNAKAFVSAVASEFPCIYVYGNHEHWSNRIYEMRKILIASGVTVLTGNARTVKIKGVDVDFCGIDDPTYMVECAWFGQLDSAAAAASPSHLKILLSHRAEYASAYEKRGFDLVLSGHLHGGQWRIPGLDIGGCAPSSGGPVPSERRLFPRRAGGAYKLDGTTTMVVSRGLARESTPIPRFFNRPELVVVDVKGKGAPSRPSGNSGLAKDATCPHAEAERALISTRLGRVLAAAPFAVLFLFANGVIFINNELRRKKFSSYVPPLGGLLGAVCVWNFPFVDLWHWAWVPFLLDGCILSLVLFVIRLLLRRMRTAVKKDG